MGDSPHACLHKMPDTENFKLPLTLKLSISNFQFSKLSTINFSVEVLFYCLLCSTSTKYASSESTKLISECFLERAFLLASDSVLVQYYAHGHKYLHSGSTIFYLFICVVVFWFSRESKPYAWITVFDFKSNERLCKKKKKVGYDGCLGAALWKTWFHLKTNVLASYLPECQRFQNKGTDIWPSWQQCWHQIKALLPPPLTCQDKYSSHIA